MTEVSVNEFLRVVDCTYDNEHHPVRYNGAVLRRRRFKTLFP